MEKQGWKKVESFYNEIRCPTCDGVTSWVSGRPSDTGVGPGWTVDGVAVAVAARSDPGCVEACGCAESDSAARRARRRAHGQSRSPWQWWAKSRFLEKAQGVACRASDGGKAPTIYMIGARAKNHGHTHAADNQG